MRGPELSQRMHEFITLYLGRYGMRMLRLLSWVLEQEVMGELIAELYFKYHELKLKLALREDALEDNEDQEIFDLFSIGDLQSRLSQSVVDWFAFEDFIFRFSQSADDSFGLDDINVRLSQPVVD